MRRYLRPLLALIVVAVAIGIAWRIGLTDLENRERLAAFIGRVRVMPGAKSVFVLVYGVASAVGIPASPFTLAGGVLFGVWPGLAVNWLGAMLGASLGYGLSSLLRDAVLGWLSHHRRSRLMELGSAHGARLLFRLRVLPVVPFALLNAASALVSMRWSAYLLATGLGIVPVVIVYTTFAASVASGARGAGMRALVTAVVSGAVLVALSFGPRVLRRRSPRAT